MAGPRRNDWRLPSRSEKATAATLAGRGRPTRVISLAQFDEATLGALLMHFILETIVAAHLLGVDPFTQPAVDEGKLLTRQYLLEDAPLEHAP